MMHGKACPLEVEVEAFLRARGVQFTRPERDASDPTNLDFFLSEFNLYIEVKLYHTDRVCEQLARVPHHKNVLVLIGARSFSALERLFASPRKEGAA